MTEESVTTNTATAEQKKPIAAARRTQQQQHNFVVHHVDSGGGGDCQHSSSSNSNISSTSNSVSVSNSFHPIPAKRSAECNKNDVTATLIKDSNTEGQIKSTNNIVPCSSINSCGIGTITAYQLKAKQQQDTASANDENDEDDRLSSASPDSATYAGDMPPSGLAIRRPSISSVCYCSNPAICVSLRNILDSFKNPLSEEQAWSLIYQMVKLYHGDDGSGNYLFTNCDVPETIDNVNLHNDGTVHFSWSDQEQAKEHNQDFHGDNSNTKAVVSPKKILRKLGIIVYKALDYYLQADEQCQMSQELEELITFMTAEDSYDDCIDEGIDEEYKRWDDESEDEKCDETKEFDYVLEACKNHANSTVPETHYRAVCRALVAETLELRLFLQKVLNDDTEALRIKADSQTSKQELATLGFNDWARFWVQVIDELRRGVRLKKNNYSRTPIEFELTPYEILMEDIRSKKYQLRKVMVNGDIPPRVKKDAHAMILEFIRSRPPLKKASERKLPPPLKRTPSPREQLMDSIRKGRQLKHIQPPSQSQCLLPPSSSLTTSQQAVAVDTLRKEDKLEMQQSPRSKQRLIKVDFSLLQDENMFDESLVSGSSSIMNSSNATTSAYASQPKMPPYPIGGYLCSEKTNNTMAPPMAIPNSIATRVLRRTTYDLATQCESRRASIRRHTIVGCQSNLDETHSMPPSRPDSRQSDIHSIAGTDSTGGNVKHGYPLGNCKQQIMQKHTRKLPTTYTNENSKMSSHQQQQQQQQSHFQTKYKNTPSVHDQLQQQTSQQNTSSSNASSQVHSPGSSSSTRSASSIGAWTKSFLDEKHWAERGDDRLSLTLEEIVHIRSVMTKAELEGLPVGVRVKEDVEKRKVCFLCLRTRFSIFGPWGIQCKLCQRTVCSKCYTKMRIPTEHFRNVPVVLISPSLLSSPAGSSTPSPSHHAQHIHAKHSSSTGNILDEAFPKTLIERLLRSESERKNRNTVGSVPSSPRHQRSNMSTPGTVAPPANASSGGKYQQEVTITSTADAIEATDGYDKENSNFQQQQQQNGGCATATNKQVNSIMSRSMEGPRSLPVHSPARTYSNSSTLDRKSKFSRAFTLSSSSHLSADQKENLRGELMAVCNDCEGLLLEIIRSSKQTRSSARNRALKNLTLDLSPVYK